MTDSVYKIFIDTSAWIALISKRDSHHLQILTLVESFINEKYKLITSHDVVCETITFLRARTDFHKTSAFWQFIHDGFEQNYILQLFTDESTQLEAWAIIEKYSDHPLSFADATSMAIMQRFNLKTILTLDQHFAACGLKSLPKLS